MSLGCNSMGHNAISKLHVHQLQRLRDVTISLPLVGVVAIVGVNGSGKSTVLRALACVFKPQRNISLEHDDYRPTRFFIRHKDNDWSGSHYEVWIDGQVESKSFKKDEDGWQPLAISRFERYVKYIGIGDVIPHIERDVGTEKLDYQRSDFWGPNDVKLPMYLGKVGQMMSRTYPDAGIAKKDIGTLKSFMYAASVDRTLGQLTYPSHYMGAGEQKIFEIVREVLHAPKGAMILIEEPEVSLHNKAMNDLLVFLDEQAQKKALQIILSSHWLGLKGWAEKIAVFSLHVNPNNDAVTCSQSFDPSDQFAMSGDRADVKKITVWVEDELARSIVDYLANQLGVRQFIKKIGVAYSANNLFSLAAGLVIDRECVDDVLIVGDGDVATSDDAKSNAIKSLINGIEEGIPVGGPRNWVASRRDAALALVSEFLSPDNNNPEEFFLNVAKKLVKLNTAPEWLIQDVQAIENMQPAPSAKTAFYELARMKSDSEVPAEITKELSRLHARLIQSVAHSEQWPSYIQPVKERLLSMCRLHKLIDVEQGIPVKTVAAEVVLTEKVDLQ